MDGNFPPNFYVYQDHDVDMFLVCGPDTLFGDRLITNIHGAYPELRDAEDCKERLENIYGKFPH